MDSRFSTSRLSGTSSVGFHHYDEDNDDDDSSSRRLSLASSGGATVRNSMTPSYRRIVTTPEDVFADPPDDSTLHHNVFATPTNSEPSTPNASQVNLHDYRSSTPSAASLSLHRSSLSFSLPRTPSPLPVADGGRGYFPGPGQHVRTVSLARSTTPSIASTTNSGHGLARSNTMTTNNTTSNSSALYSIPSRFSQISGPPSPGGTPRGPTFNYGGHQQTLSIHDSEMSDDPFADQYGVPVSDGFRRERVTNPPSRASQTSTLPPPYTRYPDQSRPGEGDALLDGGAVRMTTSADDSGVSFSESHSDRRRSRRRAGAAVPLVAAAGLSANVIREGDEEDEPSGNNKEWKNRTWRFGIKTWVMVAGIVAALLIGLAVGLGVGLGIGLHQANAARESQFPEYTAAATTTTAYAPPDKTDGAIAIPNEEFPNIPAGTYDISPLSLTSVNTECVLGATDQSAPSYFQSSNVVKSLWSCSLADDNPMEWDIEAWPDSEETLLKDIDTWPTTLTCADWDDTQLDWGAYLVSSTEGTYAYKNMTTYVSTDENNVEHFVHYNPASRWRDGLQNVPFVRQPLGYYNATKVAAKTTKRSDDSEDDDDEVDSYKFGILYNKTVIVKEKNLEAYENKQGVTTSLYANGTLLEEGDVVWMCVWHHTLLEVEILIDKVSKAAKEHSESVNHGTENNDDDTAKLSQSSRTSYTVTVDYSPSTTYGPTPTPDGHEHHGPYHHEHDADYEHSPWQLSPEEEELREEGQEELLEEVDEQMDEAQEQAAETFQSRSEATSTAASATTTEFSFAGGSVSAEKKRSQHDGLVKKRSYGYGQKVNLKESRPSANRIKQILDIDLTDSDPDGDGDLGSVVCTKAIMMPDGGLKEDVSNEGEGKVTLTEDAAASATSSSSSSSRKRRKRGDTSSTCICAWSS